MRLRQKAANVLQGLAKKIPNCWELIDIVKLLAWASASELGIAPKIIYSDPSQGSLITSFICGQTLTAATICMQNNLVRVVALMKKYHAIPFKKEFESESIYDKLRSMLAQAVACRDSIFSLKDADYFKGIIDFIQMRLGKQESQYAGLCHCDLFPPNFIDDGTKLWLIDWEYACWGNILFDLANLCIESNLDEDHVRYVLEEYFGSTWRDHYDNFQLMCAIFNLRNALWYDLRSAEIAVLEGVNMKDYALKHMHMFEDIMNKNLSISSHSYVTT